MSSGDILDLIDSAVRDWETGPDAVRYNAKASAPGETWAEIRMDTRPAFGAIRMAAEFEHQMLAFQHGMATLVDTVDTTPLDQLAQYLREMQQQRTCFVCGTSWFGAGGHECNPRPCDVWAEHQMRVQLLKTYRVRPHEIGIGDMGCACHPAPFPAARDYRRRTRHRNRRRQ